MGLAAEGALAAKNVAYKRRHSRLWATAQPRLSYIWTDPRTKT